MRSNILVITAWGCLVSAGSLNLPARDPSGAKAPPAIIKGCETAVSDAGRRDVGRRLDEWRQALAQHRAALEQIGRRAEFAAVIELAEAYRQDGDIGAAYDALTCYASLGLWRLVESSEHAPRIYVDGVAGDDARSGQGGWTNAVKSIQDGVNKAGAGCMVLVAPGHYKLTSEIMIEKGITLRSWDNGGLDPENTMIDGQGRTRCIFINHERARVAGFTLTGGNGAGKVNGDSGGAVGIYTRGGVLSRCIVRYNSADINGGGVYVVSSRGCIEYCDIHCNAVTNAGKAYGGGVYMAGGALRGSTLAFNTNLSMTAYRGGGGVYIRGGGDPERCQVAGCVISNNQAYGGAGMILNGSGIAVSNTIAANRCVTGGHSYGGGAFLHGVTHGTLFSHNTVSGNTGASLGGGIYIWPAMPAPPAHGSVVGGVLADKCTITDNVALKSGGGVHVFIPNATYAKTRVLITAGEISRNRVTDAAGKGGGVFWDAPGRLENCVIAGNRADQGAGGGLYLQQTFVVGSNAAPEKLIIRNCRITGNRAGSKAGVFLQDDTAGRDKLVRLEDCEISGNELLTADQD